MPGLFQLRKAANIHIYVETDKKIFFYFLFTTQAQQNENQG